MVKKKRPKVELLFIAISICFGLACLTFYIWYQTEIIRLGLEIRRAEETINKLETEIKSLEAVKASLLSLERVEKIARQTLNLAEPQPAQLIYEEFVPELKR